MGQLEIVLPDDLENKFRRLAFKKFGYKRGAISAAAGEAIRLWIKKSRALII